MSSIVYPPGNVALGESDLYTGVLTGDTLFGCLVETDAYVNGVGNLPGTMASSEGLFELEFQVTDPVSTMMRVHMSGSAPLSYGPQGGTITLFRDSLTVASWQLQDGELYQTLQWDFGTGDWKVDVYGISEVYLEAGDPTTEFMNSVSLNVQLVPAPASVALAAGAVLLFARRRRRDFNRPTPTL